MRCSDSVSKVLRKAADLSHGQCLCLFIFNVHCSFVYTVCILYCVIFLFCVFSASLLRFWKGVNGSCRGSSWDFSALRMTAGPGGGSRCSLRVRAVGGPCCTPHACVFCWLSAGGSLVCTFAREGTETVSSSPAAASSQTSTRCYWASG